MGGRALSRGVTAESFPGEIQELQGHGPGDVPRMVALGHLQLPPSPSQAVFAGWNLGSGHSGRAGLWHRSPFPMSGF